MRVYVYLCMCVCVLYVYVKCVYIASGPPQDATGMSDTHNNYINVFITFIRLNTTYFMTATTLSINVRIYFSMYLSLCQSLSSIYLSIYLHANVFLSLHCVKRPVKVY